MATEYKCMQNDRRMKEKFIDGINNKVMTANMNKELMATDNISKVTSEQMLILAKIVEAQRSETTMLESIRDNTEFGAISKAKQKAENKTSQLKQTGSSPRNQVSNCKYCRMIHQPNAQHIVRFALNVAS